MKTTECERPLIPSSVKTQNIKEYYFSGKLREIDVMRERGVDVINLGIGSPDLIPSKSAVGVLEESAHNATAHGYQGYSGIYELRDAFAVWYSRYFNTSLDPSGEILPLMGSKEGIMHISMAFVNPGEEVLVPDPGYPAYAAAAHLCGASVMTYDLTSEKSWYPDLELLEAGDLSNVKLMWVNYPHMPTGQKASFKVMEELVAFGKRNGILICNDNPYSFILNDKHISILSVPGSKEVALELNSVSKSHNMPGWRVGMVAGHRHYIDEVRKVKSNMDSGMFRPLQLAVAEALREGDDWYEKINREYSQRRVIAECIMDALGCSYDRSQGGMFLWGKIPDKYIDANILCDEVLYELGVFITPGIIFGNNGRRYLRISLCASQLLLQEALNRVTNKNFISTKKVCHVQ